MSGMRSNDGGSNNNQARVRRAHAQIVPRETKEPNVATELRLQIMHCCCVNENVQAARVLCITHALMKWSARDRRWVC